MTKIAVREKKIINKSNIVCPYIKLIAGSCLQCKRGYATRELEFRSSYMLDKHMKRYCKDKYTSCGTYEKLERAW